MDWRIAILDAVTPTGEAACQLLAEHGIAAEQVVAVTAAESTQSVVAYGDDELPLQEATDVEWSDIDAVIVTGDEAMAAHWVPLLLEAGCRIVDDTAASRHVAPLLLPEWLDAHPIPAEARRIAVPCALSAGLALVLKPLQQQCGVSNLMVTTQQSVSGAGRAGMDALATEVRQLFNGLPLDASPFPARIAFNLIPQIGALDAAGWANEERKLMHEVPHLLDMPELQVAATCVLVPVFFGHSATFSVRLHEPRALEELKALWRKTPGVLVLDDELPTPDRVVGVDEVVLGRLRVTEDGWLHGWLSLDNLRRGAAVNSVRLLLDWQQRGLE